MRSGDGIRVVGRGPVGLDGALPVVSHSLRPDAGFLTYPVGAVGTYLRPLLMQFLMPGECLLIWHAAPPVVECWHPDRIPRRRCRGISVRPHSRPPVVIAGAAQTWKRWHRCPRSNRSVCSATTRSANRT